jgi:hypothetical protein
MALRSPKPSSNRRLFNVEDIQSPSALENKIDKSINLIHDSGANSRRREGSITLNTRNRTANDTKGMNRTSSQVLQT